MPVISDDSTSMPRLAIAFVALCGTVFMSDVAMVARPGVYSRSCHQIWNCQLIGPSVNVHWFAMACDSVAVDDSDGVYFWPFIFGQLINTLLTSRKPADFAAKRDAKGLAACPGRFSRRAE